MNCNGGILIIPTNFFCDNISKDVRTEFLDNFDVKEMNIFTEPIFESTTYSICSFAFDRKKETNTEQTFIINKFPEDKKIEITLYREDGYRVGGPMFRLIENINPIFTRLLKDKEPNGFITKINLTTIDTRTEPFHLEFDKPAFYGKNTDRTYATLVCSKELSLDAQRKLVEEVNEYILEQRKKYGNLLFTNYRDYNRKRVEFDFIYRLLTYFV